MCLDQVGGIEHSQNSNKCLLSCTKRLTCCESKNWKTIIRNLTLLWLLVAPSYAYVYIFIYKYVVYVCQVWVQCIYLGACMYSTCYTILHIGKCNIIIQIYIFLFYLHSCRWLWVTICILMILIFAILYGRSFRVRSCKH